MKTSRTRRLRIRLALAAAVLIPAFAAAAAMAHDAVESTVPAKDTTVTAAPAVVSLTLSEPPLDASQLNLSVITVTDAAGTTLSDGKVTVDGPTISTAITAGTNGEYKVLWRTVSSDGHPIEGTYSFTVQDPAQAVTAAPAPTTSAASASSTPAPAAQTAPEQVKPNDDNAPVAVGIAAAILAVAAAVFFIARKRRDKASGA